MNLRSAELQTEKVHLKDYMNVILRGKITFLATTAVIFTGVALYTLRLVPVYESSATMYVREAKSLPMGNMLLDAAAPVDSEIEILKSRSNVEKVVAGLHLDWQVDERSAGMQFKLLDFSSQAKEPIFQVKLLGSGSYQVWNTAGDLIGTGKDGILLHSAEITMLLQDLEGKQGDSFRLTLLPFNTVVKRLKNNIKALEVGKKTNVISVSYQNHDPQLAQNVVNTLIQAYLGQGLAFKAEEGNRTIEFIGGQLTGVKSDLEGAESNLQAYQSTSGVIKLDDEAQNLLTTLTQAEQDKAQSVLKRKEVEFALASLKNARSNGDTYTPALLRKTPLVEELAARLSELEVQKKGLLSDNTESHPGIKLLVAQIDEVQKKLQGTYEAYIKAMQRQEENLSREISRHDARLRALPTAQRDLARLTRLSKVNADIYTFLLQKREEARIAKASTISSINVVDPAIVEDTPIGPNRSKYLLLGLIAGLLSGAALCFFKEYLDDAMKDLEQIKKTLDLPILTMIPFIPKKHHLPAMVTHFHPTSPAAEAFRALRLGLHFSSLLKKTHVTLVTSCIADEGKSTVSTNLGIALAQYGSKVLIVDCDLRRSTQHLNFGHASARGLSDILTGDINAAAAVQATVVDGLHLVQAGTSSPNPAYLLGSEEMARFISEMKVTYSNIILDLPPVLAVTDAAAVAPVCDTLLLVMEIGRVSAKCAARAKEVLVGTAQPIAGVVISATKSKSAGYPDAYGYGYGYGYGYRLRYQDKEDARKPLWPWR